MRRPHGAEEEPAGGARLTDSLVSSSLLAMLTGSRECSHMMSCMRQRSPSARMGVVLLGWPGWLGLELTVRMSLCLLALLSVSGHLSAMETQ